MSDVKTIKIDDVEYVRKDSRDLATNVDGLEYCIVRTYSAGVFAGFLKNQNGKEGVVLNARRLWYWSGAASLSQLAMDGVKNPSDCKFPCEVPELRLTEIIEVIPATQKAKTSIEGVKVWAQ